MDLEELYDEDISDTRINIIGQNGNDGEHYEYIVFDNLKQ